MFPFLSDKSESTAANAPTTPRNGSLKSFHRSNGSDSNISPTSSYHAAPQEENVNLEQMEPEETMSGHESNEGAQQEQDAYLKQLVDNQDENVHTIDISEVDDNYDDDDFGDDVQCLETPIESDFTDGIVINSDFN